MNCYVEVSAETLRKANEQHVSMDAYLQILEEKAKKWDSFAGLKSYEETMEKARLWDDYTEGGNIVIYDTSEIIKLKDKAQKWDDLCSNTPSLAEMREKAQKWDECQKSIGDRYPPICGWRKNWTELEDKAKKWDLCTTNTAFDSNKVLEYIEKAKRYDEWSESVGLPVTPERYMELEEKAQKWDQHIYTENEDVVNVVRLSLERFKELEEKANHYDKIKEWYEASFKKWEG